jgi:arsenical pump membrane protein
MVLFGAVLISASLLGMDLGLPTLLAAVAAIAIAMRGRGKSMAAIAGAVSWSVLPMVAGLFVLVDALRVAGLFTAPTGRSTPFPDCPRSPHLSASRFYRTS